MNNQIPGLQKLNLSLREDIRHFCAEFDPYSDFNFTSLFCWDTDNSTEVGIVNGNMIIKFMDYVAEQYIVSVLGDKRIDETLTSLLGYNNDLSLVPEVVIKNIKNKQFFYVEEDPDSYDYIYELADLANMSGNSFKKKRNKLHKVNKTHGDKLHISSLDVLTEKNKVDIKQITINCHTEESGSDREDEAVDRILKYYDRLDLTIIGLFYEDKMVGFSINEKLSNGYAICHFEKVERIVENINIFMVKEVAKTLLNMGCKIVNWEQDLGIEGLRKSKTSFQPKGYLTKFYVRSISGTT